MPKGPTGTSSHIPGKEVQFLESKVNRLRWINNDLNKQVFEAVQRGHRLAAKLGYQNLEDAELALATQPRDGEQSQLEAQLSQHPPEELATHVQDLQSELIGHINLSKSTLAALEDALHEMNALREENAGLRREVEKLSREHAKEDTDHASEAPTEAEYLRAELKLLQKQYADLQKTKEESEKKHAEDYTRWKNFKIWLTTEQKNELERAAKRRKLTPLEEDMRRTTVVDDTPELPPGDEWDTRYGLVKKKFLASKRPGTSPTSARSSTFVRSDSRKNPVILASRDLNSPSRRRSLATTAALATSSAKIPALQIPQEHHKRRSSLELPQEEGHASSETEPETQSVTFIYPSQIDVTAGPSTIPQKRSRSPEEERSSSETEFESQAPTFVYPSQIPSEPPQSLMDMTPKPRPAVQRGDQLWTPISALRPQQISKGKVEAAESARESSPTTSATTHVVRPALPTSVIRDTKPSLLDTPISPRRRKGKGRVVQGDKENGGSPENTPSTPVAGGRQLALPDYSVFKGRGRYGKEQEAANETINALYALDPKHNDGVGFQFEEVVRDKQRRKHMHAVDCECCRDYYEAIGPLPAPPKGPVWRSPRSTPSKRRCVDSFEDDDDEVAAAAIEEHKQAISRHREHWPRAKTPPRYWNIEFPTTQQVEEMNAEAARMHEEKRQMIAREAARGGRFRRR